MMMKTRVHSMNQNGIYSNLSNLFSQRVDNNAEKIPHARVCSCENLAVLKTVTKESLNKGN